jgi:hypothetical protein
LVILTVAVSESELKLVFPVMEMARRHDPTDVPFTENPAAVFDTLHTFDFVVTLMARPSVVFPPFASMANLVVTLSRAANEGIAGVLSVFVSGESGVVDELLEESLEEREVVDVTTFGATVVPSASGATVVETDVGLATAIHSVCPADDVVFLLGHFVCDVAPASPT